MLGWSGKTECTQNNAVLECISPHITFAMPYLLILLLTVSTNTCPQPWLQHTHRHTLAKWLWLHSYTVYMYIGHENHKQNMGWMYAFVQNRCKWTNTSEPSAKDTTPSASGPNQFIEALQTTPSELLQTNFSPCHTYNMRVLAHSAVKLCSL